MGKISMLTRSCAPVALCALIAGCAAAPTSPPTARLPVGVEAGDQDISPFYRWTGPLPARAGVLLRREPMPAQPELTRVASGERILYTSNDVRWKSGVIPVSGTLYLPQGTMPAGGWPIVAWAHGTVGVADSCAPSWALHRPRDAFYINRWLHEGFAVVATDYQGLGGPGPHPYLFWEAEARSILDSVRAALSTYPDRLANRVVITGQSQGSSSTIGANRIAPAYAPELNLMATIATGVALAFPKAAYRPPAEVTTPGGPAHFTVLRLLGGAIPDGGPRPEQLMSDKGRALLESARTSCLDRLRKAEQGQGIHGGNAFIKPLAQLQAQLLPSRNMDAVQLKTALFLGTGLADRTITPRRQYAAAAALCAAGNRLIWKTYAGATHNGVVNAAFDDEVAFVRQAMAGAAPASNCNTIAEPGPVGSPTPKVRFND